MKATKRLAPKGYVAINKTNARVLYDKGIDITICGNNVNSYHVFGGWSIGCTINRDYYDRSFDDTVQGYMNYLDNELGIYPVFYVKKEHITV